MRFFRTAVFAGLFGLGLSACATHSVRFHLYSECLIREKVIADVHEHIDKDVISRLEKPNLPFPPEVRDKWHREMPEVYLEVLENYYRIVDRADECPPHMKMHLNHGLGPPLTTPR